MNSSSEDPFDIAGLSEIDFSFDAPKKTTKAKEETPKTKIDTSPSSKKSKETLSSSSSKSKESERSTKRFERGEIFLMILTVFNF